MLAVGFAVSCKGLNTPLQRLMLFLGIVRAGGEIHAIPQPEANKDAAGKESLRCGAELSEVGRSFSKPLKMRKRGVAARGRVS